MRHLGPRVATLVDGRMTHAEEERAWAHVHGCPLCSEAVQREGWVKHRLAGLSQAGAEPVPDELWGSLCNAAALADCPADLAGSTAVDPAGRTRWIAGFGVLGAGSVSAAMVGVVVLGVAPANAPGFDRVPATITQPSAPQSAVSQGRAKRPQREVGFVARQVAADVGAGMRMGQ